MTVDDITQLLQRGVEAEGVSIDVDALALLAQRSGGDGRQSLTALEVACALARPNIVSIEHVEAALGTSALKYGRDDHYDVISAFIKSMRASNVDASVFWLARLLESGDDPSFIARRMIIFASEDIGMADPQALVVAVAASQALHAVGLPEAQLNLAQGAVYLASAPKANHVAQAIWTAREDVRNGADVEVPPHLRDSHYSGASELGHGVGYQSPHNDHVEVKKVEEDYLPAQTEGRAVRRSPYYRG